MTISRIACILLLLIVTGCTGNKGDQSKRINFMEKSPLKVTDTGFGPYYKNIYFLPYIIRLDKQPKSAFIQVDSAYFAAKRLDANTREDYYNKVIALLPKEELQAHKIVWALPEMRKQQQADGGYGTIVTWTKERMDKKSGYYLIEVRRNDVERLSVVKGTSYFRIRLHPMKIEIADESGYFVSLEAWRRLSK